MRIPYSISRLPLLACLALCGSCTPAPGIPASPQGDAASSGPPRLQFEDIAIEVHRIVNRERTAHGLPALTWNGDLAEIATSHSKDMAGHDFFSHDSPRTGDPTARGSEANFECTRTVGNYRYTGIAENIFKTGRYHNYTIQTEMPSGRRTTVYNWKAPLEIAEETVAAWMNSPGHRANLLHEQYASEGIGIAGAADLYLYVTQNFC